MRRKLPYSVKNKLKSYPEFYRKVWEECFNIPRGTTVSYKELAEKIGHKGSARAVGNALAKNPFAPIVPCHRVVRSDGKLGGYSGPGGLKTKRKLLEIEKNERVAIGHKRP